ncbi:Ribonuclease H-like domain [Cinara cedri]|uniref:Ribonuclease H-like domain n=1 Tax=Cinara cedri TaxID=506608 RepID=A0A5E4N175_9HEMI|nr:Ribonuclease H-like domain [Cinara cedri]
MGQIISDIGNNYVYIIVDETTDPSGSAIAHLSIGKLDGTPSKSYLVACKELGSTNYETICQFIDSSLNILPGIGHKLLLFISDAVNTVIKKIQELYPNINRLINNAPLRINKYRKEMLCTSLPPEPIITRWGTWLNVALFYANNFEEFKNAIGSLTSNAKSFEKLKQLVQNNAIKCGLAFIKLHFSELSMNLNNWEESNSELLKSMDIFRKIEHF